MTQAQGYFLSMSLKTTIFEKLAANPFSEGLSQDFVHAFLQSESLNRLRDAMERVSKLFNST